MTQHRAKHPTCSFRAVGTRRAAVGTIPSRSRGAARSQHPGERIVPGRAKVGAAIRRRVPTLLLDEDIQPIADDAAGLLGELVRAVRGGESAAESRRAGRISGAHAR
jgi:hypothetical protein